ncbi:hypothetical protein BOTBODRAFT_42127 [Botryobasidium botryosum FD-172 SS1]|uniref:non-specific serine/threonine protein kinase n=1 Tax=Botryobasidium botryosum (strain FD-172 SS1) TaxID=930990 RepID=A0A067N2N5_BOTB1|nr:hypothetical protein BOTBODRAFT_42127 [Botryobasidium botryosum FD-172 SS1]
MSDRESLHAPCKSSHSSIASSGSTSGFPEEDLREAGRNNSGYYPARLGQSFERGRLCVVRKLGWGQYSSVWLARDKEKSRFVALKILTCDATKALSEPEQRSDELSLLRKIADSDPSHPGFPHNIAYLDFFDFLGPHGSHRCVITEVLGYNLNYIRRHKGDGDLRVQPSLVKCVVKQVLKGLEYLHDVCGIVHADIKHDNILFRPADIEAVATHELATKPSMTYDCGTELRPSTIPVVSQALPLSTDPLIDDKIIKERDFVVVISDFGHSHWRHRHFQEIIQPSALRAPEVILGYKWDTPADIWNVGCIVTELLVGSWLFEPNVEKHWGYEEDHLARMTEALDCSFDVDFLAKCEHRNKFFQPSGVYSDWSLAHFEKHLEPTRQIDDLLRSYSLLQDASQIKAAERFILRCLRLIPGERTTAKELADDPWLA